MTKYERLMNKADECTSKALATNDVNLKKFYANAAEGYNIKAGKLTVQEAGEQIINIYISGKITGDPDYKEKFERIANALEKDAGIEHIVNPAVLDLIDGGTWEDYMKRDIPLLTICDAIFMMKGWRRSKGARLERYIAKKLGLLIIYER